jgi:short-subunit dehydrogenase
MKNNSCLILGFIFLLCSCATSELCKRDQQKLSGKTVVIVGASSGFGRGVAVELGKCHANVVLAARRKELLEEVAKEVRSAGGTALVVVTDISKVEDVQNLADAAIKQYGHIDVWINNAGVGAIGPFWDIPIEEHARLIDINLKGIIYGCHIAVKLFKAQGYGTIINTGSIDSEVPLAYQGSYSASKAGVRSLGQVLHQELRLSGIREVRVITIMPWAADTPWWRHAANHSGGTPRMGGMDDPQKVVNAIVYACLHKRKELPVGWKARASYISHHIFPHFTERISANMAHHYQIETAPHAPPTSGSLFKPMESGRDVDDGVRKRMKEENRQRKLEKKNKKKSGS